jgi:hypothetical protein
MNQREQTKPLAGLTAAKPSFAKASADAQCASTVALSAMADSMAENTEGRQM